MPIQAEITINAPPHVVREVMLDFDKLPQWHTGDVFFSALKAPAGKKGSEVVTGEKITVSIPAMSFSPVMVVSNSLGGDAALMAIFPFLITPIRASTGRLYLSDLAQFLPPHIIIMDGRTQSNTPEQFSWLGSLPFIYTGQHDFFFHPSPSDPNVTLFKQQESFSGLLAWAMGSDNPESSSSKKVLKGWTKFNEDLKRRSEEVYAK